MWKVVLIAVALGCTSTGAEDMHVRWPRHRQMHDDRLDKLQAELEQLRARVATLEAALHATPQ